MLFACYRADEEGTMIRLAEAGDAEAVAEIYRPSVAARAISFEMVPPTAAEMERRIAQTLEVAPWLVYQEPGGKVAGYAYASKHRERAAYQWSVDVSAYVGEAHRRRGIGRALYTSLVALLRLQGFYAAHAGITLPNAASVGLHEALGFRLIGVYPAVGYKLGAWHDVGWWQLALRDRSGEPAPPRSPLEAQRDPGWNAALAAGHVR
jgi:phosphinothricin acetyltransferase